ncbi:MAG: hypothetical protein OXC61_08180 [Flavobacteriaceae bacterium]|nr:hypothetical protein [Flavobacteriaceae bacterium]
MNIEKRPISETNTFNKSLILSKPTLWWLDEARTLQDFLNHPDKPKITSFLDQYHNLKTTKGFVLL